jgi:regulatory protein
MRKGRPVSDSGRDAGGPRDSHVGAGGRRTSEPAGSGGADGSDGSQAAADSFDPFESFDAHDRAAGLGSSTRSAVRGVGGFPSNAADAGNASDETVYTRSRRSPGEAASDRDATSGGSSRQRPTRSLKGRALAYLSRREYSRAELSRKLAPYVEEGESLDTVLDALERENWLSDSRFTESLVHRRASRLGAGRIVGELKRHAVSSTLIEETAAQLRETELARAQAVWRKKYGQLPATPAERARQVRFLVSRGFSQATVAKILKGIDEDFGAD